MTKPVFLFRFQWNVKNLILIGVLSIPIIQAEVFGQSHSRMKSQPESKTVQCGTKIKWVPDHHQAFQTASGSNKPLLVLHLSGDFQNEDFT